MKTLILYKSKFGAAEQYARWLAEDIPGSEVFDIEGFDRKRLIEYDIVILGLRTTMGKLNRLGFLVSNWPVLKDKKVFVFTTGLQPPDMVESKETYLTIPEEMRVRIGYAKLPGTIDLEKMNFFEKLLGRVMQSAVSGPLDRTAIEPVKQWFERQVDVNR